MIRRVLYIAKYYALHPKELQKKFQKLLYSINSKIFFEPCTYFTYLNKQLPLYEHKHNVGNIYQRMTERAIELPIAELWLDSIKEKKKIIEIGAVTPYYWPGKIKQIVDPTDSHNAVNIKKSLFDVNLTSKNVLSISTIEHVGTGDYNLHERKTAIQALKKIVEESSQCLISFPIGYNSDLDEYIENKEYSHLKISKETEIEIIFYQRNKFDNNFIQKSLSNFKKISYGPKWANGVIFIRKKFKEKNKLAAKKLEQKEKEIKIHIVADPEQGWILNRIAQSYHRMIKGSTISATANEEADVNFYINYYLFHKKTKCDVGFFTHREKDSQLSKIFDHNAQCMDWCIAMCQKTAEYLPSHKTTVVHVAPDEQFAKYKKKIIFGIVGREYSSGRKRTNWIYELRKLNSSKIEIKFTNQQIPWKKMPLFYKNIDYLLVLSDNEGGPVPILEALAMGVPIISSDVGFASEFTTIRFKSLDELKEIIRKLIIPDNAWEISAEKVQETLYKAYIRKYSNE